MGNEKSLAHTRWNCKYHIVFAPKYRRQVFYREILEAECCADHIHMLVEIPPKRRAIGCILRKLCEWKSVRKMSVSGFMGYLKGKSSLMLYEQFGDLKFKYRNREFWCRGYYVDTVGKNTAKIQDYIKHQLEEDKMGEQLSIPYPGSPFTGRK
uniref:Transposase IS200-like domain-containing protein n=1 Tax=Escherichia coli TaxID=562 RepID=Q47028_ECOLX|nr:unknown [Escherichia coli]prf//2002282C insertion sequence IS200 [Escherichia coli]